jgi:hypothetical protein
MKSHLAALLITLSLPHCAVLAAEKLSTKTTPLIASGEARCAIVFPKSDALSKRAAERLLAYFFEQTGVEPGIVAESEIAKTSDKTLIVLDGTKDHHLLSALDVKLDVPTDRDDAYHLKVVPQEKRTVIAIAGHTPSGAKYGAYRLMEELEIGKDEASVARLDLTASPFFKTRSVSLFNIWRVPVEVIRQCNLESWPAEKIQANVDMYDAFGFNALETHDRFHEGFLKAVFGTTRLEWRNKVWAMCDRAHEDGMTMFLRQWGNSVEQPIKELKGGYTPFGFNNLAPDIPEERKRWESEIRDYVATNYASHIDHFIGHWADAGGIHDGSHATIKDAMLLHNELRAAFRAINPKIETSFNLWGMANPKGHRGWPGYVDHRSVTSAGILEKDVIIAQTTRAKSHIYSQKETDEIIADGYRAAVWTWRRGDTEVRLSDPGLRIRIHGVMGDYFHDLPDGARKLEWHNIERNHHGMANDVNYYVASKLMWDPKTDVDAALNKYCALVFGKENEKPVAEAFLTIEASRDVENQVSKFVVNEPVAAAKRARQALTGLAKIKLAKEHHSRLPSVTSPEEMLKELRETLDIIAQNADICAKELPAIVELIKSGKTEEAKARAAAVQKRTEPWFGTIAGGVEGMWLKETIASKFDSNADNKVKQWFGFRTRNLPVFEQKESTYTVGAEGKTPGFALLSLDPSSSQRVEFHFTAKVAARGKSRNAGLAVGTGINPNELVLCQVMIGGRELRITGKNLVKPAHIATPDLDPAKMLDCIVTVDPNQHSVTFTVGSYTAKAHLKSLVTETRWFGYVVENTTTQFGKIDVKPTK